MDKEIRYIGTNGTLIQDIDVHLESFGEPEKTTTGFMVLFEQFSQGNVNPLKEPLQAIICNSLSLLFDVYPPLPILKWLDKALYDGYLDHLNEEKQDRRSIEELLGLESLGKALNNAIKGERDLRIALMYHNFKHNKVGHFNFPRESAADIIIKRINKNPSLLGHQVHQELGCPQSTRQVERIYGEMKKKYPEKFISLAPCSLKVLKNQ